VNLRPSVVVILAGTNDVAGNTGQMTPEAILGNLQSMAQLSRANGITPVLASILPAADFEWSPGLEPGPKIAAVNVALRDYARKEGIVYLDYYTAMVDGQLGLRADFSSDGVHPNATGYAVMAPLAERAIAEALKSAPASRAAAP